MAIEVRNNPKQFNCHTCQHRHCDETGDYPGSKGPAGYPKWDIPGVFENSRTCPKPTITEETRQLLRLHTHYKNGLLPLSGGVLDQPAAFLDAMEIIEAYIHG